MNEQDKPAYKLKSRHIGPIMELDGELSNKNQNLIFARNGTGKSFLSRAFRYIAEHKNQEDQEDQEDIVTLLVSEEAINGVAELQLLKGDDELVSLKLNSQSGLKNLEKDDSTIFHVFSQDFVDTELREKKYKPDGNITHKIIVGSKNIELDEAREELKKLKIDHENKKRSLVDTLNKEKESELKTKAGISGALTEYKSLSIEPYFTKNAPSELPTPYRPLSEIIKDLDNLKSIPADPFLPEEVVQLSLDEIPCKEIKDILEKPISPASIAEEVKEKIDKNPDFYKYGITLIADIAEGQKTCPLCEQSIENEKAKEIIRTYVKYFEDAEAKAKALLRQYWRIINEKIKNIESHRQNINKQEKLFNDIKNYIPSQKEIGFENTNNDYKKIIDILTELKNIIEVKEKYLPKECKIPDNDLINTLDMLNTKIEDSNQKVKNIRKLFGDTGNERRELQRLACKIFLIEFIKKHENQIDIIQAINLEEHINNINRLERTGDSDDAKVRVSKTFQILMSHFFDDKYSFDEQEFDIRRDGKNMSARGNHRTLSDGEKSVVAFCYFIAMIHLKVQSNDDYKKLFLVFDDPVTSMSYDFIYSIVQVLKNLRVLNDYEVSIEPRQKTSNEPRPRLLILTHNSYFFNVALTNGVVKDNATFSLDLLKGKHAISKLNEYIAPFKKQLEDIIFVAKGNEEPRHTTANSIRSILEVIQRFCHPDMELNDFFGYITQEKGIKIKSTLINNFSHGHYGEETPTPEDLKQACEEAVEIADIFIPGQVKQIKDANKKLKKQSITNH